MAANLERLPRLRFALSNRGATFAFHCAVALAVLAVGLLGVLSDSWRQPPTRGAGMHSVFGALLLLSVIANFTWQIGHAGFTNAAAIAAFARRLSRQVYLLLYILAGSKEIQYFLVTTRAAGAPDALADTMRVLQFYLGIGVLALAAIQILAALSRSWVATATDRARRVRGDPRV